MRLTTVSTVVVSCVAIAAALFVLRASAEDPGPAVHTQARWEHSALTHDGADVGNNGKLSNEIIRMGNEGWELVSVSTVVREGTTAKTVFYFKRPR